MEAEVPLSEAGAGAGAPAAKEEEVMVATTTMRTQDYCMLGVLVLVAYVWTSLWLRRAQTVKRPLTQLSVEFRRFQRSYVAAFVLALLCEYGQASQTFALLRHSHGEDYGRIAMVYASGFAATWLTTAARGTLFRFSDDGAAAAAKNEVVCCFAGYFVASLLASKEDWGLAGVAASRVVAGCALPLLQSSFDSWMRRAHAGLGFPAAWRRSTYELAGAGTTAASIFSGVLVEIARRRYHERRAFEVTSVVAALGLAVVAVSWPKRAELYSSDEGALASKKTSGSAAEAKGLLKKNAPHVRGTCRQGLMTLGRASTSAAAVALAACLFESCAYVTNATWATTLARIHDRDDVDVAAKKIDDVALLRRGLRLADGVRRRRDPRLPDRRFQARAVLRGPRPRPLRRVLRGLRQARLRPRRPPRHEGGHPAPPRLSARRRLLGPDLRLPPRQVRPGRPPGPHRQRGQPRPRHPRPRPRPPRPRQHPAHVRPPRHLYGNRPRRRRLPPLPRPQGKKEEAAIFTAAKGHTRRRWWWRRPLW
mmetsp:Transcript_38798/g.124368  ORF Transcript_38798/g.124368 Transcript_38798/m.124368 type:complete len:535 (-) Transcript_38798:340-1944(-)